MYAIATFENGTKIETTMNGSIESCSTYYKTGRQFNLGTVGDNMEKLTKLELYEDGKLVFSSEA